MLPKVCYPIPKKQHPEGLSGYKQCLGKCSVMPGLMMIAEDIKPFTDKITGKLVGGKKKYWCADPRDLIDRQYKGKLARGPQHLYEVIRADQPARLFVDVDYKRNDKNNMSEGEFNQRVVLLLKTVAKVSQSWWGRDPIVVSHLDATTDAKFSRHIVFENIVVASAPDWIPLIDAVIVAEPELEHLIDTSVYTENRLFRLLYASKMGKTNPLVPLETRSTKYDPVAFESSLISYFPGDTKPEVLEVPASSKPNKKRPTANSERDKNKKQRMCPVALTPAVMGEIRRACKLPDLEDRFECVSEGSGTFRLTPIGQQQCFVTPGEKHESNTTMLHMDGDSPRFHCFGRECSSGPRHKLSALFTDLLDVTFDLAQYEVKWSKEYTKDTKDTEDTEDTEDVVVSKEVARLATTNCLFCPGIQSGPHTCKVSLSKGQLLGITCETCHKVHSIDVMQTTVPLKLFEEVSMPDGTIVLKEDEYFPTSLTKEITQNVLNSLNSIDRYTLLNTSNMGVGKTVSLKSILGTLLDENPDARILIECSRRTLGSELLSLLKDLGFKLYSDIRETDLSGEKRLIIQVESTLRLLPKDGKIEPYDLIVVDEWTAHLSQFLSDTVKKQQVVLDIACERWRDAKSMLCLCADAGPEQLEVLQAIRGSPVHEIKAVKPSAGTHLDYVALDHAKDLAMAALFDMNKRYNIFMPSNSLGECQSFIDAVRKRAQCAEEWDRHIEYARGRQQADPEKWAQERLESLVNGVLFLKGNDADEWYKKNACERKQVKEHVSKQLWTRKSDGTWEMVEQGKTGAKTTVRAFLYTPTLIHGASFDKICAGGHFTHGIALFTSNSTCARECVQALGRLRALVMYIVGIAQGTARPGSVSPNDRTALFYANRNASRGQAKVDFLDPWDNINDTVRHVHGIIIAFDTKERAASADANIGGLVYEMERIRQNNPGHTSTFSTELNPWGAAENKMAAALSKVQLAVANTRRMVQCGPTHVQDMQDATRDEKAQNDHWHLCQTVRTDKPMSYEQLAFLQVFKPVITKLRHAFMPLNQSWGMKMGLDTSKITSYIVPKETMSIYQTKPLKKKRRARILGVVLHKCGFIPSFSANDGLLAGDTISSTDRLKVVTGLVNLINFSVNSFELGKISTPVESDTALLEELALEMGKKKAKTTNGPVARYKAWMALLVKFFETDGMRDIKNNANGGELQRTVTVDDKKAGKVRFPRHFLPTIMGPLLDVIGRSIEEGPLKVEFYKIIGGIKAWDQNQYSFDGEDLLDSFTLQGKKINDRKVGISMEKPHKTTMKRLCPQLPATDKRDPVSNVKQRIAHLRQSIAENSDYPINIKKD